MFTATMNDDARHACHLRGYAKGEQVSCEWATNHPEFHSKRLIFVSTPGDMMNKGPELLLRLDEVTRI